MESKQINTSKLVMLLAIGSSFFAGIISSFFGIGGGIIFVPLMVAAMGMGMKKQHLRPSLSYFLHLFQV